MNIFHFDGDPIFKDVFQGSIVTLAARVANALLQLGLNIIIARYFGSTIVGILAMINSIIMIASVFTLFGTTTSILRLFPEISATASPDAADAVQRKVHRMVLFVSPIISILTLGIAFIWQIINPIQGVWIPVFLIAAAILPLHSLARLSTETLRAQQRVRLYAFAHLLPSLTNFLILILLLIFLQRQEAPIIALVASTLIVFSLTRYLVYQRSSKSYSSNKQVSIPDTAEIIKLSLPMAVTLGLQMIISNLDLILIGLLLSVESAGIYNIASKLAALTSFIITSINAVSAARFSQLNFSGRQSELLLLAKRSSNLIFWASLPILIILIIFGKSILGLFGQEFTSGYAVLVVLVTGEFINAIGGSVGLFLNMTGSHVSYRNIIFCGTVINIILNLLLIPRIGITGAGITSLVCLLIINVSSSFVIYKKTGSIISYLPSFVRKWIIQ